ncbi:uncharacterized protein TNCV_534781 [Trichonephila clavipes]|nr:uncharacterized protein TNCV_534781 [Trichonephila clavipes]
MQVTLRFGSVSSQFRGTTPWEWSKAPTSLPLLPTSREDLRLDGYLEYPHVAKALHTYNHPCLLRDSNPGSTAQLSATLTTIPDVRLA